MAFVRTNWAQFLKSDSELPTDVVFRVEERNEREERNVEKVFAHRLLLAGASPVFRKQFFGALKEGTDEVVVRDTTIEAFTTMIQFMYMAPEETEKFALKFRNCAQSLCELVNISERYQILDLNKMAKSALENFLVTEENLIFTATTARNYSVFEDVSSMLTEKCLYFLATSLTTAKDVFSLIVKTGEAFPDADMDILYDLLKILNGAEVEAGWTNKFSEEEEIQLGGQQTILLTTVQRLTAEWRVAFKFKPTQYSGAGYRPCLSMRNVLTLQFSSGGTHLQFKQQASQSLQSKYFYHTLPKLNEWTTIEVEQRRMDDDGRHLFKFHVGGLQIYSEMFSDCLEFDNVQVHTGLTQCDFSASIKDFTIETRN